jgi:hypothetical protein
VRIDTALSFLNSDENFLQKAKNYFKFAKSPKQIDFRGIDFRGFLGLFYHIKVLFYE